MPAPSWSAADRMNKPSDSVLVAIDVGTSGARASAFATDGTELAQVRRPYPTSLVKGLNAPITAIGLTGQCPSVVPLDEKARPLRPGIIYRDNRATAEAAQ